MTDEPSSPDARMPAPSDAKASEWTTALCAAGFDYALEHDASGWIFLLPAETAAAARAELEAFEADNRNWPPVARPEPVTANRTPVSWSPAWVGGLLIAFYAWLGPYAFQNPFLRAAAMDAEAVHAGQWWRVLTALLVHADAGHLMGNVACLFLLGRAACATFGSGLAWALILTAGVGGNLLEAFLFPSSAVMVGASTAGFGALGLLVGCRAAQKARRWREPAPAWREVALTVVAGLGMLAMLGTGPRSDLVAHALGMLCGAACGAVIGGVGIPHLPAWCQHALELGCIASLMLAWRAAFAAAGS